jgi:hypothetical protein
MAGGSSEGLASVRIMEIHPVRHGCALLGFHRTRGDIRAVLAQQAYSSPDCLAAFFSIYLVDEGQYFGHGCIQLHGDFLADIECQEKPDQVPVLVDMHSRLLSDVDNHLSQSAEALGDDLRGPMPLGVICQCDGPPYFLRYFHYCAGT